MITRTRKSLFGSLLLMASVLFTGLAFTACGGDDDDEDDPATPTEVQSLSIKSSITVGVNATEQLTATIKPSNAKATVMWKSGDTSIATVDANGKVTGKKEGKTNVYAYVEKSDGSQITSNKCAVTVKDTDAEEVYQMLSANKWIFKDRKTTTPDGKTTVASTDMQKYLYLSLKRTVGVYEFSSNKTVKSYCLAHRSEEETDWAGTYTFDSQKKTISITYTEGLSKGYTDEWTINSISATQLVYTRKYTSSDQKTTTYVYTFEPYVPATSINVNNASTPQIMWIDNQSVVFSHTISPSNSNDLVYWEVEDSKIASMEEARGVLTAKKGGTTRIRAVVYQPNDKKIYSNWREVKVWDEEWFNGLWRCTSPSSGNFYEFWYELEFGVSGNLRYVFIYDTTNSQEGTEEGTWSLDYNDQLSTSLGYKYTITDFSNDEISMTMTHTAAGKRDTPVEYVYKKITDR